MNIDLPLDQEPDTVPGTPAEPAEPGEPHHHSLRDVLRKHLSSSTLINPSQPLISRNSSPLSNSQSLSRAPSSENGIDPGVTIV